jgi:gliding motility-associated-like protein
MQGTDVCALENAFDLTSLEDPFFSGGNWDGPSVNVNTFNASLVMGDVVLTYQAPGSCVLPIDITLSVIQAQQPSLFTANICEAAGALDLTDLEDPSFANGTWSGNGVSGNTFNPLSQVGINNLTFTSSDYCVQPATTTVEVEEAASPALGIAELCTTGPVYDLTLLEDPAYTNGQWSGPSVAGSEFDPTGLTGNYTLTFQANGCAFEATTVLTVNAVGTPVLGFENICEQSGLYNLAFLQDPTFPVGSWSGPGVTNNFLDPQGQAGNIVLTFTPGEACTTPAVTGMTIYTAPTAVNVTTECQPGNEFYTVSFTIEGGDESSYLVNGTASAVNFTSGPIASATDFSFIINDANNCLPQLVQGNKNCQCFTNAGTMTITSPLAKVCVNQSFTASFNNNATLENDTLLFVLHTNSGPSLGTVLAIQDNPTFTFPVGAALNTTYYISAVAGNILGNFIDPADPCISVAPGTPVQFYDISALASGAPAVCLSDTLPISINIAASLPATLYLSYQFANKTIADTIIAYTDPANLSLIPSQWGAAAGPASVVIQKIKDSQCERSGNTAAFVFDVQPKRQSTVIQTLCKGKAIVVNGTTYDETKPIGTEIVPSALAGQCDSTIQVNLSYYPVARSNVRPFVCQGENVVIHGETFDLTRPAGTITLPNASIHVVQPSQFKLDTTLCAGTSATILGVTFDESHPSDTLILAKANAVGCDSIIEVKVNFRNQVTTTIRNKYCAGTDVTIGGTVFNENNASGTVLLQGSGSACDTLATVDLQFVSSPVYQLNATLCAGDSIVVNGKVYNKDKTLGTEVFSNATSLGCDSIVQVKLLILPQAQSIIQQILCPGESIVVNGITYDESKPTGIERFTNGAANGCDSLVQIELQFYPKNIDTLRYDIRPNEAITVDGVVFDKSNQSGLVPYAPGTTNGCDSATFVVLRIVNNQYQNVDIATTAPVCPGDQNGNLTIKAIEGCLVSTLIIDGVSYGEISLPFVLTDLKPGNYEVSLSSADGCSYNETIRVSEAVSPQPFKLTPESQLVYFGEDTPLDINISPAPASIQWEPAGGLSCSDCLKPTVLSPTTNIDFTLTLQDANGCEQTAAFRLLVEEKDPVIIFPNVLQPGSGGSNNQWVIQPGDGYTIQSVDIFDRWGSRIFTTGEVSSPISWDGTFNGCQLTPGVYTFVVKVTYRNGKAESLVGDITLVH